MKPEIDSSTDTEPLLAQRRMDQQTQAAQELASAVSHNALKSAEHGGMPGQAAEEGTHTEVDDEAVLASSVSEGNDSDKVGDGLPRSGHNPLNDSLDRVRVDSHGQALTTNQGVPISDNQNSLKAGLRGPTLMEDFILREKITHFDHERIPERVVHARGSAAHGYFEAYESLADITKAAPFAEAGKRTPVFVRFSTVAGERGSADTARDVRGFAVKFYTDQGNWDLVGNNMPVFFIQDAMKFPDLVHAVKPEPHNGMPQAASAHDTFWDFVSLMPESAHMLLWVMSDRGIPRSYQTMQGFGVHTYRLVDEAGGSRFVKFHWLPTAGTHSLVWDEAVKIAGADPDFHRRALWDVIEAGHYPEWELALQVFSEEQAEQFSFDVLDPTKLVPEELVPLRAVGRMVLNRNPDNFFAETEQVAFCTAHVVPGIDFSNDPLLAGRIHSYIDTQITRLGGANFHEIPINASVAPVHNNQRDGIHRQALPRGRVAYEPNSLGAGCPYQAGAMGFVTAAASRGPLLEDKVRGKPARFADHYSQAQLFWRSQTQVERRHIVKAFRFELSKVTVAAVRLRVLSVLANIDPQLARGVADGLGVNVPPPQPRAFSGEVKSEVESSPALSLYARPGNGRPVGRKVALLVAEGIDAQDLETVRQRLQGAQAIVRTVGLRVGSVQAADGSAIAVDHSVETMPGVLWDAAVLSADPDALAVLAAAPELLDFVRDQYRHGKPLLALGDATPLFAAAGLWPLPGSDEADRSDPSLVEADGPSDQALNAFIDALGRPRHHGRELAQPAI